MSKSLNTLYAALLFAATGSVFGASSVDLSVKGTITPSACTPALSSGGVYDIGKISAKDLKVETYTRLETHTMQFTVTCEAPTLIALQGNDNRAGSEFRDEGNYGLGLINGDEKLGSLSLKLESAVADGVAARIIESQDGGASWYEGGWLSREMIASVADNTTLAPLAVQSMSIDMILRPIIAATNTLTLTNEVLIDGSVSMTVFYL